MADMISLVLVLATTISPPLFSLLQSTTALTFAPEVTTQTTFSGDSTQKCDSLICQINEAHLKLARLEAALEKSIQDSNAKSLHIRECEKKIEDLDLLQTALTSFEDDSSRANERLSALEGELQLLWSISRRNNFEIRILEDRAYDAEKRLNAVTAQVEKMTEIVSEQWIQIQQLEQAVQMTQVRALKIKRQLFTAGSPFVKFMKNLLREHLETLKGNLDPYIANGRSVLERAPHHLKRTFSRAKYYHHQLQGCIKQSMLRNEFTAVLASEELVFFLASALITFPILSIYMLFSSRFSQVGRISVIPGLFSLEWKIIFHQNLHSSKYNTPDTVAKRVVVATAKSNCISSTTVGVEGGKVYISGVDGGKV